VEAKVADVHARLNCTLRDIITDGMRNHNLPTVRNCTYSSRAMYFYAHDGGFMPLHLASVQTHSHFGLASLSPFFLADCNLGVDRCPNPQVRAGEQREDGISGNPDFLSSMRLDGVSEQLTVPRQHQWIDIGISVNEPCRPLDVREQHADAFSLQAVAAG
jgi:hypothetical protein